MRSQKVFKYSIIFLIFIAIIIFLAVISASSSKFKYIACNVGQGDATLLELGTTQILIDGGPGSKVLECLGRYMPFFDREIELVVLTHPQLDHFGGLIDVFKRYKVKNFLGNSLKVSNKDYQVLEELVGGSGTHVIEAQGVSKIRVGLIYIDIVHPTKTYYDENAQEVTDKKDTVNADLEKFETTKNLNDFSVVFIASYKNFDAILTGDIEPGITNYIISGGRLHDVEVLKVPHHGSKNGLTESLLKAVTPDIATISVGKNPWGHPNKETLDLLSKYNIKTYRTDKYGDTVVESDGESYKVK